MACKTCKFWDENPEDEDFGTCRLFSGSSAAEVASREGKKPLAFSIPAEGTEATFVAHATFGCPQYEPR